MVYYKKSSCKKGRGLMEFDARRLQWTREPRSCVIEEGQITVLTAPYTDLWQRTYYGFQNDNAPVLQMETAEQYSPTMMIGRHCLDHIVYMVRDRTSMIMYALG